MVISSSARSPIWAVYPGTVTFAGSVARQKYVVVTISPDVAVTYGWVAEIVVQEGDAVASGQVLATAGSRTYLGVRRRGEYVEPLRFLGLARSGLRGPGWVSPLSSMSFVVGR